MTTFTRLFPAVGVLVATTSATAQAPTGQELRWDTRNFLFARYATASASSLYAGFGSGKAGMFFGMVENPRSGYHELIGGAVSRIVWGRQAVTVAFGAADASDSKYLQSYIVPSFVMGSFSLSGTIEVYVPVQASGTRQLDVSPVTLLVHPRPRVGVGAFYGLGVATGVAPRHRAGPVVEFALPPGALKVELVRNLARASNEVRMSFRVSF
jgi:hypothetical protein